MTDRIGRCYELAGRFIIEGVVGVLVHGIISNEIGDVTHGWVETDLGVYEPVTDVFLPFVVFERLYRPTTLARYSVTEAIELFVTEGHWGPFDKVSLAWLAEYERVGGEHVEASRAATELTTRMAHL